MNHHRHLEALRTASAGLSAAARQGGLYVSIPACPGWCMADMVWHTGTLVRLAAVAVPWRGAMPEGQMPPPPEPPPDEGLIAWFEEGAALLAEALAEHDPDDTVGQQCPPGYPGPSLYRHYAREVDVHRWDAEQAIGIPPHMDDDLAADWLDAMLVAWLPAAGERGNQAQGRWSGQSIRFRRTDGDGESSGEREWIVRLHGGGKVEVTRGHGDAHADLTVAGSGSALLLLAMNRIPATHPDLHLSGDTNLLEHWAGEVRYGRPAAGPHWLGSSRPTKAYSS